MKFLVLLKFKPIPPGDPKMAIAINEGAKAWIKAHLANGKLECAYNVISNAAGYYGMGISDNASLEDMQAMLASYPAYPVTDFEVFPLSDVNKAIDNITDALRKMTGG